MHQILKRKLIALKYIWKGVLQEMAGDEFCYREPLFNFLYIHPVVYRDHRFAGIQYRVGYLVPQLVKLLAFVDEVTDSSVYDVAQEHGIKSQVVPLLRLRVKRIQPFDLLRPILRDSFLRVRGRAFSLAFASTAARPLRRFRLSLRPSMTLYRHRN